MKAPKFPLRQTPGCSIFFGFLILFAHGAFGQDTSIEPSTVPVISAAPNITSHPTEFPTKKLAAMGTDTDVSSKAQPVSTLLVATSINKEATPASTLSPEQLSTLKHSGPGTIKEKKEQDTSIEPSTVPVISAAPNITSHPTEFPTKKLAATGTDTDVSSKAQPVSTLLVATSINKEATPASTLSPEQLSTLKHSGPGTVKEKKEQPATLKQTKQADTTTDTHSSAKREITTTMTTTLNKTETTKVVGKSHTTVGESTSFSTTAATANVSVGLKPRSTKQEKTPGQPVPPQGEPTTHSTRSTGPKTQDTTGTSTTETSEVNSEGKKDPSKGFRGTTVVSTTETSQSYPMSTASPAKGSKATDVAIVLSILLLLVLLIAFLFCWRRWRHSGSTSFKTAGWAGQAELPDDSGLDKEVEQGALSKGEGDTRRATLTTFFGKRQSRVPSVAMEEVVRKETGDTEEVQCLIDGDVSRVSSLEGSGEANGKLPEPTMQCSQEKEFPPPPAHQEETPPTKLE
ncbi:leukosialin [Heteronotia binoei]|uniref:leukosialin n=1 Tax=Heteronotia binoei TaxID=13085 RepID=UPI0029311652|nr:leukosialin [Heteronotia binoei]